MRRRSLPTIDPGQPIRTSAWHHHASHLAVAARPLASKRARRHDGVDHAGADRQWRLLPANLEHFAN